MGRATHIALISRHNERAARVRWIGTSRSGSPNFGRPPPVTSAYACSLAGANVARGRRPLPTRGRNPGGVTEANRKNQHGDPSTPAAPPATNAGALPPSSTEDRATERGNPISGNRPILPVRGRLRRGCGSARDRRYGRLSEGWQSDGSEGEYRGTSKVFLVSPTSLCLGEDPHA